MEEVEIGERVVCAANLMKDKQGNSYLIVGARHWDAVVVAQFEKLRELGIDWEKKGVQQGFIDQRGNFLTREEAWIVAEKANQIIRRVGADGVKLFSENLY